jgi:hypothetical protein
VVNVGATRGTMARFPRVGEGGGRIDREYAIGSRRLDPRVAHHGDKLGIEVKTWRSTDNAKVPTVDGPSSLDGALARIAVGRGRLLRFAQRKTIAPLPERLRREGLATAGGRQLDRVRR